MAYSSEVLRRARQRLDQAREDRESENRQHLQEAYAKIPRLQQIDRQLRQTMAFAAQSVFTQGGDVAQALNKVKEENLSLQQEREVLIAEHFPEGFLENLPLSFDLESLPLYGFLMDAYHMHYRNIHTLFSSHNSNNISHDNSRHHLALLSVLHLMCRNILVHVNIYFLLSAPILSRKHWHFPVFQLLPSEPFPMQ